MFKVEASCESCPNWLWIALSLGVLLLLALGGYFYLTSGPCAGDGKPKSKRSHGASLSDSTNLAETSWTDSTLARAGAMGILATAVVGAGYCFLKEDGEALTGEDGSVPDPSLPEGSSSWLSTIIDFWIMSLWVCIPVTVGAAYKAYYEEPQIIYRQGPVQEPSTGWYDKAYNIVMYPVQGLIVLTRDTFKWLVKLTDRSGCMYYDWSTRVVKGNDRVETPVGEGRVVDIITPNAIAKTNTVCIDFNGKRSQQCLPIHEITFLGRGGIRTPRSSTSQHTPQEVKANDAKFIKADDPTRSAMMRSRRSSPEQD